MNKNSQSRLHSWAQLRFSIIGGLLASPPNPGELKRFFKALESEDTKEPIRDYILLSLFTGVRRSNVLSMKWNDINFEHAIWIIPAKESKNAEPMVIPCPQEAINILRRRRSQTTSISPIIKS